MSDVREINQIEGLDGYRTQWSALLEATVAASFFQTMEWLEVYWRHFGADQQLRVLIVLDNGQVQGILPLVVRRESTRIGAVRVLTYPLHDWGSFYGPIGPRPADTLRAGLEYLKSSHRDWDLFELRWQGAPGVDRESIVEALKDHGYQAVEGVWAETAVADLSTGWEAYFAQRTSKWRNNLRRWERRLAEQGGVEFARYRPQGQAAHDDDPRWDLYDICEGLASRSWQGSAEDGTTLSHSTVRPFLREAHAAAARLGAVDLNLLSVNGEPAAFAYNYCWKGSVYGLRIGYDASRTRDGAGNVLYMRIFEDSCGRGDQFYDMGVGSLDIKRHIWTAVLPIYRYSHFALAAPRAQLLRCKRWLERMRRSGATEPGRADEAVADVSEAK